ncbi:homeobox protein TGIF2 isoform X2 [Octopus sinensis]|uniref:Homeobox protein TGIF2 isoform X2 n=1 Tax=Octopus sinensis TaxID=2607531 RepID=A0A6P7SNY7_9MOLL|nr:homeobox protein TGIF2 isoform X2 [Octopus sinensis]
MRKQGMFTSEEIGWFENHQQYTAANMDFSEPIDNCSKRKRTRGNLPKEAVDYLMKWLYQNRFRAYPCEETKRKMAKDTGLTIQQVNNWYINARRRILPALISSEGKEPRDYRITRRRLASYSSDQSPSSPAPSSPASASSGLPATRADSPAPPSNASTSSCRQTPTPPSSLTPTSRSHLAQPPYLPLPPPYSFNSTTPDCQVGNDNHDRTSESFQDYQSNLYHRYPLHFHSRQYEPTTADYPCNLIYNNSNHNHNVLQIDPNQPTDQLLRNRYGNTESHFRVLEFNMI